VIEQEGRFKIVGIVDKPELFGTSILEYKVIGDESELDELANKYQYALITVGQIESPDLRIKLFDLVTKSGFILPSIISPKAYVSKHASISTGTIVMHGALINADVIIVPVLILACFET
jgi:tetrahydrodipicolinate N-succinyltransferase